MNSIVVLEERCIVHAGELRALIRVDQYLILRLTHRPHQEPQARKDNEYRLPFASLASYAAALFQNIALLGNAS
jgi:hypothetical protein